MRDDNLSIRTKLYQILPLDGKPFNTVLMLKIILDLIALITGFCRAMPAAVENVFAIVLVVVV